MRYFLPVLLMTMSVASPGHAQTALTAQEALRTGKVDKALIALNEKRSADALALLEPVLAEYAALYPSPVDRVRCAGNDRDIGANTGSAVWIGNSYCFALWAKGFALVELSRLPEAVAPLELAVALMPDRAQFHIELGYVFQTLKKWDRSTSAYTKAAEVAQSMPVEEDRKRDLRRAWFGIGYNLIELGQLDQAERYFKMALEVAPGDTKILGELEYIAEQRAKKTG